MVSVYDELDSSEWIPGLVIPRASCRKLNDSNRFSPYTECPEDLSTLYKISRRFSQSLFAVCYIWKKDMRK